MSVALDHTIVPARDPHASARFLAGLLGLEVAPPMGPFVPVHVGPVTLDFGDAELLGRAPAAPHHYAFVVDDPEFDAIFARVRAAGLRFYAEPHEPHRYGEINTRRGGRAVYFDDPDGHVLEVTTTRSP
jgi:catechol 2,3-dioxygenase-like lactoylglutathione lyase family enzyme